MLPRSNLDSIRWFGAGTDLLTDARESWITTAGHIFRPAPKPNSCLLNSSEILKDGNAIISTALVAAKRQHEIATNAASDYRNYITARGT